MKQQTVGCHGDLMLIYIYIYRLRHIHQYHTKSRSKDYIVCLLWYGLYGQHLKTVWTWSKIAHIYTMAYTHMYIYIYTRKPGRSPTPKRTPYALSCPFCLAKFWLLDSFFFAFFVASRASVHTWNGHIPKPNVTRVQSATQWTASVHTLHMPKPNVTRA